MTLKAQHAHDGKCGMSTEDQRIMSEMLAWTPKGDFSFNRLDHIYIPVKFHLVANSLGEGRIPYSSVLKTMTKMNKDYAAWNIRFYFYEGFSEINNTAIFESPSGQGVGSQIVAKKDNNALNIFICQNADTGNAGGGGTTLGYYSPSGDYVIVRKQEIEGATATLSHEVGHFFSLKHTFYGWEGTPWTLEEHGQTVTLTNAPGTNIPVELVNQSNCEEAADGFCDTPPDYNFGLTSNNCSYTYTVFDRNDDLINPMINNYMGYFIACSKYQFTQEQYDAILINFNSPARAKLKTSYEPDTTLIPVKAKVTSPSPASTVPTYNAVSITWDDLPEAENFLVELTSNSNVKTTYFTKDNGLFVTDLEPNKTYIGLLAPFNEGNTDIASTTFVFKTGNDVSAVNEIDFFTDINVYPNPSPKGNSLSLTWNSEKSGNAIFKVRNTVGQETLVKNSIFSTGINFLNLPAQNLDSGIYFLEIVSENKSLVKKIVIE